MKHSFQFFKRLLVRFALVLALVFPLSVTMPQPAAALDATQAWQVIQAAKQDLQYALDKAWQAAKDAFDLLRKIRDELQAAFEAATNIAKDKLGANVDKGLEQYDALADANIMNTAEVKRILAEHPLNYRACKAMRMSRAGGSGGGGGAGRGSSGEPPNPRCDRDPACGQDSLKGQSWRMMFAATGGNWKSNIDVSADIFTKMGGREANEETWRLMGNFRKIFEKEYCTVRPPQGKVDAIFTADDGRAAGALYDGLPDIWQRRWVAGQVLRWQLGGASAAGAFGKTLSPAAMAALDRVERDAASRSAALAPYDRLIAYTSAPATPETDEEKKFASDAVAGQPYFRKLITDYNLVALDSKLAPFVSEKPICEHARNMIVAAWISSPKNIEEQTAGGTPMEIAQYALDATNMTVSIKRESMKFFAEASTAVSAAQLGRGLDAPVDNAVTP